jgi:hypothetical protein
MIDFCSENFAFCSLLRPPYDKLLPADPVDRSLENLVNGRELVDVSRNTCSSAAKVHERTMLSTRLAG